MLFVSARISRSVHSCCLKKRLFYPVGLSDSVIGEGVNFPTLVAILGAFRGANKNSRFGRHAEIFVCGVPVWLLGPTDWSV